MIKKKLLDTADLLAEVIVQGMQENKAKGIVSLNLKNIEFFSSRIPNLLEVSIGHALICESLYLGLENVINLYKSKLSKN